MTAPNGRGPQRIVADCALGYCLRCVMEYKTRGRLIPEWAITLGPVLVPVTDPLGTMAGMVPAPVPLCYDHVGEAKKSGLIVTGGSLS